MVAVSQSASDELRKRYAKHPSIITSLDEADKQAKSMGDAMQARLDANLKVEEEKSKRSEALTKMASKIPAPKEGEATWLHFKFDDMDDTSKPQTEVTTVVTPSVTDKDGKVTTPAVTKTEMRYPIIKGWHEAPFITTTNTTKAKGADGSRKLAITVRKVEGDAVKVVGNFRTGVEVCKHLGIDPAAGSANLALTKNGYVTTPYEGTDFLIKS